MISVKVKAKLATLVEGDPKAPFLIATTPRCKGGHYSIPLIVHFTLDPYLIMLSVKQGGIKYHFLSLWYDLTWDIYIYIYMCVCVCVYVCVYIYIYLCVCMCVCIYPNDFLC